MRIRGGQLVGIGIALAGVAAFVVSPSLREGATWQRLASPGELSIAHSHLDRSCSACHTPVKGAEPAGCIACHANDTYLLGRQPTAFHGSVGACLPCHTEHAGRDLGAASMDHDALARLGLEQLAKAGAGSDSSSLAAALSAWQREGASARGKSSRITALESTLDCSACHSTKDPHLGLFGADCASCHETAHWTIPEYRHPSPQSKDCAQCHLPPPSHTMMHFHMISAKVARKPHAKVEDCFECHLTTSWNDIRGVGWYKHH